MNLAPPRSLALAVVAGIVASACLGNTRVPDRAPPPLPVAAPTTELLRSHRTSQGARLETSGGIIELSAPRGDTFRVRLARDDNARALPSFAVEATAGAVPNDAWSLEESDAMVLLRTSEALLRVDKKPLRIRLMNGEGQLLVDEALHVAWSAAGVGLDFGLNEAEHVFGLGDKVRGFDRRGQAFELWNTDAYGWKVDTDPLYKSLPVWLVLGAGKARGVFVDLPARARIDVGSQRPNVVRYDADEADAFDVYLFTGPEPRRVVDAYTELTGRTPLPPLWALGHHQSRYGYTSEQEVRGVVTRLQTDKLPVDAVWLDIDFQAGNAPFTVDPKAFPTFRNMVADFESRGVRTVAITDLHVKSYQGKPGAGYAPYDSGAAGDHFIRAGNGFFEGPVWPGPSVFPEFTRGTTRKWWGELYRDFVEQGVAGFWNDMNEPALFVDSKTFPPDVLHRLDDGTRAPHVSIHNAYGSLNARATYDGVRQLRPDVRPFILTRAAFAGAQKYAASWTGDNTADRAHLAVSIPQLLNLGVSGYPFNGADVGGFVGCPDAELFAEWMELGALQPFYRNHSAKDACRREPWRFGAAVEARARRAIERRYRLLPYLYTLFEESSRTGAPVMRPLWFEYPDDQSLYTVDTTFLLGRELLVAPKLVPGAGAYRVILPASDWYDVQTRQRLPGGPRDIRAPAGDSVRVFARAGAIVPEQPLVQNTREVPKGPLTLTVWPGPDCSGTLYADDGISFAYRAGKSRRFLFSCQVADAGIAFQSESEGDFEPWWRDVQVVIHAVPRAATSVVEASGAKLSSAYDPRTKTLVVTVRGAATRYRIDAAW